MANINLGFLSQLLNQNGLRVSTDKALRVLYNDGYVNSEYGFSPSKESIDKGLISVEEQVFNNGIEKNTVCLYNITRTGQIHFIKHFHKHFNLKFDIKKAVIFQLRAHEVPADE